MFLMTYILLRTVLLVRAKRDLGISIPEGRTHVMTKNLLKN